MKKLLIVMVMLLVTSVARAETYRWTDREGTMHLTDSLGEVPSEYRKQRAADEKLTSTGSGAAAQNTTDGDRPGLSLEFSSRTADQATIAHRMEGLQQRMLNDEGTMALITPLLNDPEIQALMNDPAVLSAVQGGNIGALLNNPAFLRVLDNPRVRDIEKKLARQGDGPP